MRQRLALMARVPAGLEQGDRRGGAAPGRARSGAVPGWRVGSSALDAVQEQDATALGLEASSAIQRLVGRDITLRLLPGQCAEADPGCVHVALFGLVPGPATHTAVWNSTRCPEHRSSCGHGPVSGPGLAQGVVAQGGHLVAADDERSRVTAGRRPLPSVARGAGPGPGAVRPGARDSSTRGRARRSRPTGGPAVPDGRGTGRPGRCGAGWTKARGAPRAGATEF